MVSLWPAFLQVFEGQLFDFSLWLDIVQETAFQTIHLYSKDVSKVLLPLAVTIYRPVLARLPCS